MRLHSIETLECRLQFDKDNLKISDMCWVDRISGDFLTATAKVGALKMWNVAHQESKSMLKVSPKGVLTITPCLH